MQTTVLVVAIVLCVLSAVGWNSANGAWTSQPVYTSCAHVLQTFRSRGQNVTDGSFLIKVPNVAIIEIYCAGFASGNPKEYITLISGRSSNFAEYYSYIGATSSCDKHYPEEIFAESGRSEFYRLRILLPQLTVDINDFTFTVSFGVKNISYGTAGDMFASRYSCTPLGKFSINLEGTPFAVSPDIQWTWEGQFVDGSHRPNTQIKNSSYIGCYEDATDRLLPSGFIGTADMTPDVCVQHCASLGFAYAGLEYRSECYCGDSITKHPIAPDTACTMTCAGDLSQICGDNWKLSTYKTGTNQVLSGYCGGYPGHCYPALRSQPSIPFLNLILSPDQPCRHNPCSQSKMCIAVSATSFTCINTASCNGTSCSQHELIVLSNVCPPGMLPRQCACANSCTGARFDENNKFVCLVQSGKPQVTCVDGDPGHLLFFDAKANGTVHCRNGTTISGCHYWDPSNHFTGNGTGTMSIASNTCSVTGCPACTVYARCQAYSCDCQNGGTCNPMTGDCTCRPGYYGDFCQEFDYCSYYEDHNDNHQPACTIGKCQAIPSLDIRAVGGDQTSNTCIFPFQLPHSNTIYTQCVDDNGDGPPFACGTYFDGVDDHIDLGRWNPGPVYTVAVWVSPAVKDNKRRTIIGGVATCRDFGLYMQAGYFMAYYFPPGANCTSGLQAGTYDMSKWYLLAVTSNGTHLTVYVNSVQQNQTQIRPYYLANSLGTWIGGSYCCKGENFKGIVKSVKIWKRSLTADVIEASMSAAASYNSTQEALFNGLVAHYELGQLVNTSCQGVNHGGDDWLLNEGEEVTGVHCNVNKFTIPQGITVQVAPFDGTAGGSFEVYAEEIQIQGFLTAAGKGYPGGQQTGQGGADGQPGQSYHLPASNGSAANLGLQVNLPHRGGGGGGLGGAKNSGVGLPGGGGGYGTIGSSVVHMSGTGQGGLVYGSQNLEHLYMGSGGGSGGNAADLSTNPWGGRGGSGGGIIGLYARGNVRVSGHVSVAGEDGQGDFSSRCSSCPAACQVHLGNSCSGSSTTACWDNSGPGGGGSGGSLYIIGNTVDVGKEHLWLQGGNGGIGAGGRCGGNGGWGRMRVDAVMFVGQLPLQSSLLNLFNSTTHYQDLSVSGQKLIRYSSALQYGNEIYTGCFPQRFFSFALDITNDTRKQMTPQFCTQQCRQRGFAFSAVLHGFQCFCDNAFNSSLQRNDSECNEKCTGDPQQFCGGVSRMSVYGPKPFTPVDASNGAQQQCQPWCLAGNIYSTNPKWGFCDLSTMSSVSYQIRCQCPDGFQGANCDQPCPPNMWGTNCGKSCICNSNNTESCDPEDGSCNCKIGYQGATCDLSCSPGSFGVGCKGHCTCSETAECDFRTGECSCKTGWRGENCNFPCPKGTYGPNCSFHCQCGRHGACSPEDGTCNCMAGFKLPFCADQCDPTNYGPNCLHDCECNDSPCDPVSGVCYCNPGFTGIRCETICSHGFYGSGCSNSCQCLNGGACDNIDGSCSCARGFAGMFCEMNCTSFKYGRDCAQTCSCIQQNTATCDPLTGKCICKPGYMGENCDQVCPMGYYGPGCNNRCNCKNNADCDKMSGQCHCPAGFMGNQCENPCPDGMFGSGCNQTCASCTSGVCSKVDGSCICGTGTTCSCPPGFFGSKCLSACACVHGSCDSGTGQCECDAGWQGSQCDTPCASGTYGKNCLRRCQCMQGNCSFVDGSCSCPPGFTGSQCNNLCELGTFGWRCTGQCDPCGEGADPRCDPLTGGCLCKPGYTGLFCDRPCPPNTYGDKCQSSCSCINGACNNVDGSCECYPSYTGATCSQQCAQGTWGPNCKNNCSCPGHSSGCDPVTATCFCAPGFTLDFCMHTCKSGYYGQDCDYECSCDEAAADCSPIDGTCQCRPGFTGPDCHICPLNTYGVNCSSTCDCSDHGFCDNFGHCLCEPGYTGDRCQTACEQDVKWGKDCSQTCDCSGQHCDFRDGICWCDPGYMGQRCDQSCDAQHYGRQCAQLCLCKNGATCDPVKGLCNCSAGWDGIYCDQPCAMGKYGQGCQFSCPCPLETACNGVSGACSCPSGFMGPFCNISCPDGFWDVNCMTRCSSVCSAGCLRDTGTCKCTQQSCPQGFVCGLEGICLFSASRQMENSSGSLSGGQVAGIVIGFILGLLVVGMSVYFFIRRPQIVVMSRMFSLFRVSQTAQTDGRTIVGTDNPMYSPE
ncbi:uncharacterized protein LOC112558294 isoform X1 [Pomacea canaliculata]|uniref:uncharacterized protein LOC112558294 isoform X1 n=1 Tax=Pomacea canaliculata TaxID=400727 RepID=UPI000D72CEDE|nr:uncharacterized protein LOC112558294 isoform X1 [Pomacea canaliculata]